eukprot:scaffold1882_cov384-Prasinococcus_capsulatus_cf.AAC.6
MEYPAGSVNEGASFQDASRPVHVRQSTPTAAWLVPCGIVSRSTLAGSIGILAAWNCVQPP